MGNTLEAVSDAKDNLKDDHVLAALRKDKGDVTTLISWGLQDFTQKGDHYIGVVTCLHVRYGISNEQHDEMYIVKLSAPQATKALRDMITQGNRKEQLFYRDLLPALNQELRVVRLHELRTPVCFYANGDPENSVLILSDLRTQDFKSVPGKSCLKVSHVHMVLQELARFHASSALLEARIGRENFEIKCKTLDKEWYNVTDDALAFFRTLWDGNIENAIAILKTLEGDQKAINWLEKIKPNVYEILQKQMERETVFTTLCHADSVSNNVLFRYDESGNPVEALLLDFQILRRASLVTDLHLLLNISVYGRERKEHLEGFLHTYYNSFKHVFNSAGRQVPFGFEDLLQEYKNKSVFGALWAIAVLPMITSGGEISDWTGSEESTASDGATETQDAVNSKISGKHSELRARFMPIFDDLIEQGIIS